MSHEGLLQDICDRDNWLNNDFMQRARKAIEESDTLMGLIVDTLVDNGIDPVEFSKAMKASDESTKGRLVTVESGIIKPAHSRAKLISVTDVERKQVEWLIPGYMPRRQITTIAGDGGTGKTTLECNITAAVTTGKHSILTADSMPKDWTGEPGKVLFLTGEDSFEYVLAEKLDKDGADLSKVFTVDIADPSFSDIKFNSDVLQDLIIESNPALVIFDPIQSFVPPDIQMGWRNAMRQCLSPLVGIGKEYGPSFLIVCHTNKQKGSYGRKRLADSADIWDISRSVLIAGDTGEGGIKYLSHEKCNYGPLQQTLLYSLDGQRPIFKGRSDLKDRDYTKEERAPQPSPARDEAKELIVDLLQETGGQMKSAELLDAIKSMGISERTYKRARSELTKDKIIKSHRIGFGENGVNWVSLIQSESGSE